MHLHLKELLDDDDKIKNSKNMIGHILHGYHNKWTVVGNQTEQTQARQVEWREKPQHPQT